MNIPHSRSILVAAAIFMLNGVVIVAVSDTAAWLAYVVLVVVAVIAAAALWYLVVPAISFEEDEFVIRPTPATKAIRVPMNRVSGWTCEKQKHRAVFVLDDGSEVDVRLRLGDSEWAQLQTELERRGVRGAEL